MNNHDDNCTCQELIFEAEYSVMVFVRNRVSDQLYKWYNSVYLRQHPKASDFVLEYETNEDGEYLEITSLNPSLSIRALLSLFHSDNEPISEDDSNETLRIVN